MHDLTKNPSGVTLQPASIPQALYIHVPWCIKKCPYCDFNSHPLPGAATAHAAPTAHRALSWQLEQAYLEALLQDAAQQQPLAQGRAIGSIFIGGGTPSLISARGYDWLLQRLKQQFNFAADCEITLEANPATLEHEPFEEYLQAGINRLSLGVQSFDPQHLQQLGRIHTPQDAHLAIQRARAAGFTRLNVDLMHGIPQQGVAQALADLHLAIAAGATHISWYQLTIEPNTVFFRTQPQLPDEDILADIQQAGEQVLEQHGFVHYEVSAWTRESPSQHNLNYWQFGDYLAIGAGAHGKITHADGIYRYQKTRLPRDYLLQQPAPAINWHRLEPADVPFEFMMNALRLKQGVASHAYPQRTGQPLSQILPAVHKLQQQGLMQAGQHRLACTPLGFRYLNNVLEAFAR